MLSKGWLTRWWRRCLVPIFGSHLTAEMSTSDQEFNFFFQLNTVIFPMPVIFMEVAILGHVSFSWVRLHLRRPSQKLLMLHLLQDLRHRGRQGGELLRCVSWLQLGLGWTQAVPDVTSSIWGSIYVFPAPLWRSISVSSSPKASVPFFSSLFFSFCVKELSRLDIRASSSLMYFFALTSTSTMLA